MSRARGERVVAAVLAGAIAVAALGLPGSARSIAQAADVTAERPCGAPPPSEPTPKNPGLRERGVLGEMPATHMNVNETRSGIDIWARFWWNPTLIRVVIGQEYVFTASGEWDDGGIWSGPEGYVCDRWYLTASAWMRRAPHEHWFALICMVNQNPGTAIAIGHELRWAATANGRLECFANDIPFMYLNNAGRVKLTVTRVK